MCKRCCGQCFVAAPEKAAISFWIPAFAGMTEGKWFQPRRAQPSESRPPTLLYREASVGVICCSVIGYTVCMSLFSPKKESDCMLIFDIGSGSVGGAIVLTSRIHPPTVLYNFRSEIRFQEEATSLRLLSLMLQALSQVVLALSHEGFDSAGFGTHRPRIKEAVVSLSAPWILSRTSFLRLRSEV